MSYRVTRVRTRGRARHPKGVLTNLLPSPLEASLRRFIRRGERARTEENDISIAASERNILRIFSGAWFRLRCNALRGSERAVRQREMGRGVETLWCSMVRCNLCGSFFPEC